jgi:PrtD family type I secretion system ABC transporter
MAPASDNFLKRALRECRVGFVLLGVFSFFINLLILTSPIYMMQVYDRVLSSGRFETLLFLTLIAGIAVLTMGVLEAIRGFVLTRIGRWLDRKLSPSLIEMSMRGVLYGLPASAQPLRDLAQVRGFLGGGGINSVFDAPWAPIFLAVIWVLHPMLGMLGFGAAVILAVIAVLNEYLSRKPLTDSATLAIVNMQKADAAVRNADVFHAMGMLPGFLFRWAQRNDEALALQRAASDRNAIILGFSKFFRVFVQILILAAGAYLVLKTELSSGGMIAASILLGRALAPIEQAIGTWKSVVSARDAYDRLRRMIERLPPAPANMPLPAPSGRLSCEQVIYVPRGRDQPVLQGVSFMIEPGEALGIIGPSAAGKSTLCRLLVGSWQPTRGHVRLDGADVFTWPSEQLGPYIGYLPQTVELFGSTVADSIARLLPEPDPNAIIEAASIAGVHEMILRLPHGYETEIGDGGSILSGGQRQRIGLARALFGRPRLVVLDEPNASLDSEGEESLIGSIETVKEWGGSVVIVAHQPRILQPVDKLLLLRDGKVELFGPRDDVLAKLRAARPPGQTRPRPPAHPASNIIAASPAGRVAGGQGT